MRILFFKTSVLIFLALLLMASSCEAPGGGQTAIKDPSNFKATITAETKVDLSWTVVSDATGYSLERKPDNGTYAVIAPSLAKTATTYADTSLEAGKSYTYRLKAVRDNTKSNGVESPKVTLPLPGTPFNVTALEPIWLSKQPKDGNPSTTTLAPPNVTESGTTLSFVGAGEALYYLGGVCTKFSASVSGSGIFKVFADDVQLWTGTGTTGDLAVIGKQHLSLVSTGNATWTKPQVTCSGEPAKPSSSYMGGKWGSTFKWGTSATGLVATHAANLPNGNVISWSAWKELAFGLQGSSFEEKTEGYLWNPISSAFSEADAPNHDMFCAGLAMTVDGRVFGGGGGSTNLGGSPGPSQKRTSYFKFNSTAGQWLQGNDMIVDHWYGTAVAMPDNRIFMVGGSGGSYTAEMLSTSGTWSRFNEISGSSVNNVTPLFPTPSDMNIGGTFTFPGVDKDGNGQPDTAEQVELAEVQQWYPYLNVAPDGKLFQSGPLPKLRTIGVGSNLDINNAGTIPASHAKMRTWGNYVMFDEGKILVSGGSIVRGDDATNTAMVIDINGGGVNIQLIPDMRFRRSFHNSVVLPTGDVLIIGGNNSGKQMLDGRNGLSSPPGANLDQAPLDPADPTNGKKRWPSDMLVTETVYTPEVYSPDKNTWRDLTAMTVPRNYHSVALLLQDGRVLAAGGGLCGDGCATNHPNGQIYEPAYLFNADGSPAARPAIGSLSVSKNADGYFKIGYGQSFTVTMTELGGSTEITKFSMVKLSAVTHGINTDLRYLEYTTAKGNLTGSDKNYQLTTSSNKNVLTPGYYFLFAINDKGVPSVGQVIQVQ